MGYSIGWLAVQTNDADAVYQSLQVKPTDNPDEYFDTPISGVTLNTGWILLVAQGSERLIAPQILARVSTRWPCVGCLVEEHVMASSATFWSGGVEVWSIVHEADQGILHLEARGQLPDSFVALRDEKIREQQTDDAGGDGDVDHVFEVPLLVAKQFTGFKHDEPRDASLMPTTPVAFSDIAPKKRGWLPW